MFLWGFCSSRLVLLSLSSINTNTNTSSQSQNIISSNWNNVTSFLETSTNGRSSCYKVDRYALQEDEYFISRDGKLCSIFDGHGGSAVSRYVRSNLFANFQTALAEYSIMTRNRKKFQQQQRCNDNIQINTNNHEPNPNESIWNDENTINGLVSVDEVLSISPAAIAVRNNIAARKVPSIDACTYALRSAFHNIHREVQRVSHWSFQGTTAVTVLVHEEKDGDIENHHHQQQLTKRKHIISVNIGDSRAVLSRDGIAVDLTTDHKPNDPNEKFRIEQLGGEVEWCGMEDECTGEPLLDTGVFRINGNLAVSRSIGDRSEHPFVSSEPEIRVISVLKEDEFVVLGSDGLFDVMTSQEVVSFVHNQIMITPDIRRRRDAIAKVLAEEAIQRGSLDNVSVIIIWLKKGEVK